MARLKAGWVETRALADGSFKALLRYRDPLRGQKLVFGDPLYGATEGEARARAEALQPELVAYLAQRTNARREPELMALGDWVLGDWRDDYEPKLPSSSKAIMRQWWGKWVEPLVGNTPLGYFSPELIDGLAEHMQELGATWPTVETAVKHVRRYLRDAVAAELLPANPLQGYRLEAPELTAEEIEELGDPDFALELEHAVRIAWCMNDLEDAVLAETMCTAALRPGEARALTFASVLHPKGRPLSRMQVKLTVSGRGSARELRGTKKTRGRSKAAIKRGYRSPQIVPSLGRLYAYLWELRGRPPLRERIAPGASYGKNRELVPELGVKNEANWRRREFQPAVERAGVQELYGRKITPREFRAAAASAYGHARETELSARAQLGHSADSTTLQFYFSAYNDPDPELEGQSVEKQLQRARTLTLAWMERRLAELAAERERVGETPVLVWEEHGDEHASIFTADFNGTARYAVWFDGKWRASLGRTSDHALTNGRTVAEQLATVEEAKQRAERQAVKRRRQSLTIQRERLQGMLGHLRVLVAESPAAAEQDVA
jgi:hypothetical protein